MGFHANPHVNSLSARAGRAISTEFPGFQGGSPMQTVADILKSKPDPAVHTIGPAAMVIEAMRLMEERRIGALVVMKGDEIVGIVTERDYAQKIALRGRASRSTPVRDIMTSPVIPIRPDQTSEDCMVLMGTHHMRHLPVIDGGRLVGMVSIRDLVNDIIANL